MILGDNIFDHDFSRQIKNFKKGGLVFAKKVHDPERYGVVEFDKNMKAISFEEKPKRPKSNYAVVGLYVYDNRVIEISKNLKPSARGELEICDLHNAYLRMGELNVEVIEGIWEDAGTFDSLLRANILMAEKAKEQTNENK
jgi:glucose-1-phosphate thymidylyltransferase